MKRQPIKDERSVRFDARRCEIRKQPDIKRHPGGPQGHTSYSSQAPPKTIAAGVAPSSASANR